MSKPDQAVGPSPDPPGEWTRVEHYLDLGSLWRRAGPRYRRRLRPRTEPSAPRLLSLGMLPFVLLMAGLAVLSALVIIAAVPGKQHHHRPPEPPRPGTAPAGWLDG